MSVNPAALSTIEPKYTLDSDVSSSGWYAPASELASLGRRMDLLESNVKALPALIAESVIASFSGITYIGEPQLSSANVYSPNGQGLPQTVWHNGMEEGKTIGLKVDLDQFLLALEKRVSHCLRSSVDFSELDKLRARIKELEEDFGYRQQVADKLREEPAGS